ncbi:MAG: RecX family transcriptional regulator [Spirochaetaceae bacterium]|jgi:regulatory protein|nr:RecX family transcriptional regulator [Spirochaetaceae bacterium]
MAWRTNVNSVRREKQEKREKKTADKQEALQDALHLVARAEQFSAGLLLKLQKKGHSKTDSTAAVEKLTEIGMLDDNRYARLWLEARMKRRSESPRELSRALCGKGIRRSIAAAALKSILSDEDEEPVPSCELALLRRFMAKNGLNELTSVNLRERLRFEGFTPEILDYLVDE